MIFGQYTVDYDSLYKANPLEHARSLIRESDLCLDYGEMKQAKRHLKTVKNIRKRFPEESSENLILLAEFYISHNKANRKTQALKVFFEMQDILIDAPDLARDAAIFEALDSYNGVGENQLRKLLDKETLYEHALFLISEAEANADSGDEDTAKSLLSRAKSLRRKFPRKSFENVSLLWESCDAYGKTENYRKLKSNAFKARKLIGQIPGDKSGLDILILKSVSDNTPYDRGLEYAIEHYYQEKYHADFLVKKCTDHLAFYGIIPEPHIDYLKEAIEIYQKEELTGSTDYYKALFLLGKACTDNYYYEDAILVLKAIPYPDSTLELHEYIFYLTYLIQAYTALENYSEAEKAIMETWKFREISYELHGAIGDFYATTGNYDKAEKHFQDVMTEMEANEAYAAYLHSLGKVYEQQDKPGQALDAYHQARKIQKKAGGKKGLAYLATMESYLNLLNAAHPGKIKEREIATLVKDIKETTGTENIGYCSSLNLLGKYYHQKGKHGKALTCFAQSWDIINRLPGSNQHSLYKELAENMGRVSEITGNPGQAASYYQLAFQSVKETIYNGFTFLPVDDKELFLNSRQSIFHTIKDFSLRSKDIPSVAALCYDVELFHKNLLLTSSTQLRDAVLNSGDTALRNRWNEIKNLKEQVIISRIRKDDTDVDALLKQIQAIESELTRRSGIYKVFKNEYHKTWQDVKNALSDGEAAIEFTFAGTPDGEVNYFALLIRPEYSFPRLVPCCSEQELQTALPDSIDELYSLVWQSLDKELEGVSHIYISAAGLLHHVPFAALRDGAGDYLINKYELHHLLSTREIISTDKGNTLEIEPSIALFGGMYYILTRYERERMNMKRGQGFHDLSYSEEEVDSIGALFISRGWQTDVYTGTRATEGNFKALSSQSPPIIHVSTHGFYYRYAPGHENMYRSSADPLMRSGLVFTGVNDFWTTNKLTTDAVDDGVLCAYEISSLDLSGTQLAVLSACNTAKGDIINNEGAYGLQRAFRLAGVKSMITTLWSVNDKEAKEFMVEFYRQWVSGLSLREAFVGTQRRFRDAPGGNISKWAGFVLIE